MNILAHLTMRAQASLHKVTAQTNSFLRSQTVVPVLSTLRVQNLAERVLHHIAGATVKNGHNRLRGRERTRSGEGRDVLLECLFRGEGRECIGVDAVGANVVGVAVPDWGVEILAHRPGRAPSAPRRDVITADEKLHAVVAIHLTHPLGLLVVLDALGTTASRTGKGLLWNVVDVLVPLIETRENFETLIAGLCGTLRA